MSRGSYTVWVLMLSLMTLATHITCQLPPDFGGSEKNAWPEYIGFAVDEIQSLLIEGGNYVFIQKPDRYMSRPKPVEPVDLTKDIWLYTDYDDIIVIIPKRGIAHHNPLSGWDELVGVPWEEAKDTILEEIIGVKVVYGLDGFPRDRMYDINRVFLDVSENGTVAISPRLG